MDIICSIASSSVNTTGRTWTPQDTSSTSPTPPVPVLWYGATANAGQAHWRTRTMAEVLSALTPECETFECILDWFHIAQKFQQVKNAVGEAFTSSLESAKWKLYWPCCGTISRTKGTARS